MPAISRNRVHCWRIKIRRFARLSVAAYLTGFHLIDKAHAQTVLDSISDRFDANFMLLTAAVLGTGAFGILSAVGWVHSRRAVDRLRADSSFEISNLKAELDRTETLMSANDQFLIIWDRSTQNPTCIGNIANIPVRHVEVLAFGSWLEADPAARLDRAVQGLRQRGELFSITAACQNGGHVDIVGRTAGSSVFLCIRPLNGERLANAELRHGLLDARKEAEGFRTLLEGLPMPVWLRDDSHNLTWVNNAYARAVDAADTQHVIDEQHELLDQKGLELLSATETRNGRREIRTPAIMSGKRHVVDVKTFDTDGSGAGIAIDASATEEAQLSLERAREFHARTLDQLATAVAIFGPDKKLRFHNEAYRDLFGLASGYLEQKPTDGEILDSLRASRKLPEQADYKIWKQQIQNNYQLIEASENWWHMPDGQTLRVVATPQPEGGVTYIYENVTEQLNLEKNYNALISVQGETLDHLKEGVAVFASDGKLRLVNPAFARIWSCSQEQLKDGTHVSAVFAHCRTQVTDHDTWDRMSGTITGLTEQRRSMAVRLERVDASVVDCAIVPLPDGATMVTFVNVTDTVKFERLLVERNEALITADNVKMAFIQHVSYELRSPLTNIIGFTELLNDRAIGDLNDKQHEYTGHIVSSSAALLAIINDILDLASIDAGVMDLELAEVDLKASIDGAIEGLQDRIAERKLNIQTEINPGAASLIADGKRVRQVLFNLLSNAIAFSEPNANIRIIGLLEADSIIIRIKDNGCGMPVDFVKDAFGRFESRTAGGSRRGPGLGLSIVKSLVELHGGSVVIQSAEGEGTTAECRFPVRPQISIQAAE